MTTPSATSGREPASWARTAHCHCQ
ncbi:maize insect resistance3 [Zea mays]|uniref:Insect resistance3 n=1 Tax=Zea mays TaxID=4577 RepID=A0A1D6DW32_MAIZE|nr:maize insect resistance3 [Zea mays]